MQRRGDEKSGGGRCNRKLGQRSNCYIVTGYLPIKISSGKYSKYPQE